MADSYKPLAHDDLVLYDRSASKHLLAIMLAVGFSIILHIFLFLNMPQVKLQILRSILPEELLPAISLSEVFADVENSQGENATIPESHDTPGALSASPEKIEEFIKAVDDLLLEPDQLVEHDLIGDKTSLSDHGDLPEPELWTPRQEILAVEKRVVNDEVAMLPRREVMQEVRTANAPDISMSRELQRPGQGDGLSGSMSRVGMPSASAVPSDGLIPGGRLSSLPVSVPEDVPREKGLETITETREDISPIKPIDDFLKIRVFTYSKRSFLKEKDTYFRIEINRTGEDVLPVLPKDLVVLQDCSASMTEQKLYFCRQGLENSIPLLGEKDRFNILGFRDRVDHCFPSVTKASDASKQKARDFIRNMRSTGGTDIYASMQNLLSLKPTAGRPLVVMVITDGRPTTGLMDSGSIIESFSDSNAGKMSVFTMGTIKSANAYLLDLMAYRNKGDSRIVTRGRWEIPEALEASLKEVSRPVLSELRFNFAQSSQSEVYPKVLSNLYLDRPLVLHGRVPQGTDRLVFQVVGESGTRPCDMAFTFPLAEAESGGAEIREDWAWQKVYHLIGEHTRTSSNDILKDIRSVSRAYGIKVPYAEVTSSR